MLSAFSYGVLYQIVVLFPAPIQQAVFGVGYTWFMLVYCRGTLMMD